MWRSAVAVCVGGMLGCVLRWCLGLWLNGSGSVVPLGTLTANLVGGYIVGVAVAFFALNTTVAPEWRVLIITGFCGGLTTFSSAFAIPAILQREHHRGYSITLVVATPVLCAGLFFADLSST